MTNEEALDILERQLECDNYNCPEPLMSCSECPYNVDAIDYDRARKMAIEALSKQSVSSDQADKAWEMLMGVHDMPDVPDEAKDIIGDVMLMLHQMIVRADESIIADFVKYQKEWIRAHSYYDIDECGERAIEEEFLPDTEKEYIHYLDKLGQFEVKPGKNGEDKTKDDEGPKLFGKRTIIEPGEQFIGTDLLKEALDQNADSDKMVDLKMRTITERLIIAKSLIDSVIADSDNDQFRDSAKKTDSERVALPEQEKSNSFSKEPSEEVIHEMNCIPVPLIRCKNCAHSTEWYGQKRRCFLWHEDGIDVWEDGYCNYADRKEKDVPDINVGNTIFKPGDKFILELGQERKMFGEFEIAGTDLYVETTLLEKLKRYEPEIIDIAKVTMAMAKGADMVPVTRCKDCKYSVDEYNDGDCYCRRPQKPLEYVGDWNFFCGAADRKAK